MNSNKFIPSFLHRIDNYLLKNKPAVWSTRIHFVAFFTAVVTGVLLALLLFVNKDPSESSDELTWVLLISILVILSVVIYLMYLLRFNVFKRFGEWDTKDSLFSFLFFMLTFAGRAPGAWDALLAATRPEARAILVYPSGTTGPPKGAVLSHANLVFAIDRWGEMVPTHDGDDTLAFLPLCHMAERMMTAMRPLAYGGDVHFAESPETVLENLREVSPTVFFAEVDGKLAGRIRVLTWWNQFGYIEDLVVNPEYRGLALGRKLLERGIQWARANGFPGVMLETQDDNVPVQIPFFPFRSEPPPAMFSRRHQHKTSASR